MSIAYEVPTSVSASSIVPHAIGVQFKHNDSLLGRSGGGYSCNYDGTYRISSKYVDDYIDGQAATVLVDRDYALIYITVKNNTSSSMNYISQFSLVTTGGTSYTPLASYSKDVGYSSSKTISPGSSATYGLYYQMPTRFSTSKIESINYTGSPYSLSYISSWNSQTSFETPSPIRRSICGTPVTSHQHGIGPTPFTNKVYAFRVRLRITPSS